MKKSRFFITCIITAALVLCLCAAVYASSTSTKTVMTYNKADATLKFDIYLSGGTAIVGYCSFGYDTSVLTLLDRNMNTLSENVPDFCDDGKTIYLKQIVSAHNDFVITDIGKGSSKLIDTDKGNVFFAWFLPGSTPYVDATEKDILIASINFKVNENSVPDKDSVFVADKEKTSVVDGWFPGIIVMDKDKKQFAYDGSDISTGFYSSQFNTAGEESIPSGDVSSDNTSSDDKQESEPSDDNANNENNSPTDNDTSNNEDVDTESENTDADNTDKSNDTQKNDEVPENPDDAESSENTEDKDNIENTKDSNNTETQTPDNNGDESDTPNNEPALDNVGGNVIQDTDAPSFVEKKNFAISAVCETDKIRLKWNYHDSSDSIYNFAIIVCDSSFDIIKQITGISAITNSYTIENLYGGTLYNIYMLTTTDSGIYMSDIYEISTADYSGYPPVIAFDVSYENNGAYLYGTSSEKVLYGAYVSKIPTVYAPSGMYFLGWSKDGKRIIDIEKEKIYSNTVFYPVLSKDKPVKKPSYINGYDDGSFKPDGNITRAEAATIISRISEKYNPEKYYNHSFNDCEDGMWYNNAIAFCSENGYIKGYDDGSFRPDGNITRAEFAAILVRVFDYDKILGLNVFSDIDSHWGKGYICALYSAGIVTPDENRAFCPNEKLTRQDAVKMINAALDILPDRAAIDKSTYFNGYKFTDVPQHSDYYYDIMAAIID